MIVLIDHYDSFVHNLARYLNRLGQDTRVIRFDQVTCEELQQLPLDALVLSPGPCSPQEAAPSLEMVRQFIGKVPILGVCLGHQCMVAALGGEIIRASEPMHGRTSNVFHDNRGIFQGLENPITACRYHSLVVDRDTLPEELEVAAWLDDETVMAIRHRELPFFGIQFHPESVLTSVGYPLLANFLEASGLPVEQPLPTLAEERLAAERVVVKVPDRPITF
ncbi:MAG: aminodeoxychorismate/anthranilate synthase component II [Pirellulaceae bacterium]|nr:aminodeoxychorismate/anthranilate synthase component II [Pirellulaceae bacterium]